MWSSSDNSTSSRYFCRFVTRDDRLFYQHQIISLTQNTFTQELLQSIPELQKTTVLVTVVNNNADVQLCPMSHWFNFTKWLRLLSTSALKVLSTQPFTVSNRAFPVAASHIWKSLPLSSPKWPIMCWLDDKPYSLTQGLTRSFVCHYTLTQNHHLMRKGVFQLSFLP